MQVKHCCRLDLELVTVEDIGLKIENFASCTTNSGSDVNLKTVNYAKGHDITWDLCFAHQVCKACKYTVGTSTSPAASKITPPVRQFSRSRRM